MTRQTRLWFLAGLLVTLLAVPVIAVAVTNPATVQQGTTFIVIGLAATLFAVARRYVV